VQCFVRIESGEEMGPYEETVVREWLANGVMPRDTPIRALEQAIALPACQVFPGIAPSLQFDPGPEVSDSPYFLREEPTLDPGKWRTSLAMREGMPYRESPYQLSKELGRACSSPLAGWLILLDNDWERCEIDGIQVMPVRPAVEIEEPSFGFDHVCPGRHLVQTTLPMGVATLDVLLHPGDMLAFRLNDEMAAWDPVTPEERILLIEGINHEQLEFYNYFDRVADFRVRSGLALPSERTFDDVSARVAWIAIRLEAGESSSRIANEVRHLAGALVGLPLPRFAALGRQIAAKAYDCAAAGKHDIAELITRVGLALFPGESSLLACLARLAAADHRWDEALELAAQARPHADSSVRAWLDDIRQKSPYR